MSAKPRDEFNGKRITVMGLGRFGGQVAVVNFLVKAHAIVTVTDLACADALTNSLWQIDTDAVTLHLGEHLDSDFIDADLIVVSPAVPKDSKYLKLAIDNGVPVSSEMNLFFRYCRAKIIGVTGTAGKSTTVAMVDAILNAQRETVRQRLGWSNVHVGGNIGHSLLECVFDITPSDLVVLELSSFQLDDLAEIHQSPHIALVTNLFANHLDRHKTFEAYRNAKANIARFQSSNDVLILNADDASSAFFAQLSPQGVAVWRYGAASTDPDVQVCIDADRVVANLPERNKTIVAADELTVPGRHNLRNAAAASAIALAIGLTEHEIADGLKRFRSLPHRLELVSDAAGVKWFNDSKSTTPESGIVALNAFQGQALIAIVGGYDKALDLSTFTGALATRATLTICIGQTGSAMAKAIAAENGKTLEAESLDNAVQMASHHAKAGAVVLLSPGLSLIHI